MAAKKTSSQPVMPEGWLKLKDLRGGLSEDSTELPPVVMGKKPKWNWKFDPETGDWTAVPLNDGSTPLYVLPEKNEK